MVERFFTNGIDPAAAVADDQMIPVDEAPGGSDFITPLQVWNYISAKILAGRGPSDKYSTDSSTAGFTVAAAKITAPNLAVLDLTGALAAGDNVQLDTVAHVIAGFSQPYNGQTYLLRIINNSSGAFAWTVTTNTGWTLVGTMTIGQNTYRDFLVTLTDVVAHTATLQNVGSGGN
jgi:hypothetical protein